MSPPHSHAVIGSPQGASAVSQAQTAAEKQAAIANEKRRRRRESHNAVERRRRDNINEKISELATLIPECMLDVSEYMRSFLLFLGILSKLAGNSNNPPNLDDQLLSPISPVDAVPGLKKEEDGSTPSATGEPGVVKANKGMILRKSVEYIRCVFSAFLPTPRHLLIWECRYLQQLVTAQGARNRELEQELKAYRSGNPPPPHSSEGVPESPEASNAAASGDTSSGAQDDMVLVPNIPTGNGQAGFGFTLPPTNEDEEMPDESVQGHERGDSEESLSPAASGGSAEGEANGLGADLHEERGRSRDVVSGRRGLNGNIGEGIMNMNVGMVAMET